MHDNILYPIKDNRISFLRFVACLLIVNSHCGDLYPISLLAIGGGQGNVIFFIISGYCLANIETNFIRWIAKRYKKILPITLFTLLLRILLVDGVTNVLKMPLDMTIKKYIDLYWFVFAIMIYYIVFFLFFSKKSKLKIITIIILYIVSYFLIYFIFLDIDKFSIELEGFSPFKVLFYFGPFVSGGIIRLCYDKIFDKNKTLFSPKRFFLVTGIIIGLLIWAMEYVNILIYGKYYHLQFLIHLGIFIFGISLLLFVLDFNYNTFYISKKLGYYIELIGNSTLAIYLIQVSFKPFFLNMDFPTNAILFWIISICGGCLYNFMFQKLINACVKSNIFSCFRR